MPDHVFTHDQLAQALLAAVRSQDFGATKDSERQGRAVAHFPSIDLAVVAFPRHRDPVWANVLFSRDHPQGIVASIPANAGTVQDVRYEADQTDRKLKSIAWSPAADWNAMRWRTLSGPADGRRFVQPYPASLIKLMLLVGVAHAIDIDRGTWNTRWTYGQRERSLFEWAFDMTAHSCNESTSALVAWAHAVNLIRRDGGREVFNAIEELFWTHGLETLRFADTRPDGGWGNAAGSGVGHLQMTSWDTARLLWLLDGHSPPPPWLATGKKPLLSQGNRARVIECLAAQGLHGILSSSLLAGLPAWQAGIPAPVPAQWRQADRSFKVAGERFPGPLEARDSDGPVEFAHKTGTTENYASDAGIVTGRPGFAQRHYLVSVITNLGKRYAPVEQAFTTWRIPALGAAIDARLAGWLEP